MGVETALLIAGGVSAAAGAIGGISSGFAANKEKKAAAALEKLNADMASREIAEQTRARTEELTRLKETQKMAMIKSGMGLAGSALLLVENTKRQLNLELASLQYKGEIESYASSLKQQNYISSGRAALLGGYTKATQSVAGFAMDAYAPSGGSASGKTT